MNKAAKYLLAAGAITVVIGTITQKPQPPQSSDEINAIVVAEAAPTPSPSVAWVSATEWNKRLAAALTEVKQEKQVRDASWLNERPASLLAGTIDDGSRKDGYAGYLCMVLAKHGIGDAIVRIMDVVAATRDQWKELGRADCPPLQAGPPEFVDFSKQSK